MIGEMNALALGAGFRPAIPSKRGEREKIKVAYVVLSRGQRLDKPCGLPFFSLVSMKAATERLRRAGIEVFAKEVEEASTPEQARSRS